MNYDVSHLHHRNNKRIQNDSKGQTRIENTCSPSNNAITAVKQNRIEITLLLSAFSLLLTTVESYFVRMPRRAFIQTCQLGEINASPDISYLKRDMLKWIYFRNFGRLAELNSTVRTAMLVTLTE